jgi:hypothetical protein
VGGEDKDRIHCRDAESAEKSKAISPQMKRMNTDEEMKDEGKERGLGSPSLHFSSVFICVHLWRYFFSASLR